MHKKISPSDGKHVAPSKDQVALRADNIRVGYRHHVIIEQLSLTLPPGKVTAIVGPNGCGKSTLLSALARLREPDKGQVLLDGHDINRLPSREVAKKLALLPQEASAPEGMTAFELIRFGRQPHQGMLRQWSDADQRIVEAALAAADISDLAHRPLDQMSGGQRQRAWIAMSIAQATPLLLLDEPTSALDVAHQYELLALIKELNQSIGLTVIMVLHDVNMAAKFSDHLIALHSGHVIASGAPDTMMTPETLLKIYGMELALFPHPTTGQPISYVP